VARYGGAGESVVTSLAGFAAIESLEGSRAGVECARPPATRTANRDASRGKGTNARLAPLRVSACIKEHIAELRLRALETEYELQAESEIS
jgi:hypothetical protein